LPSAQIIAEPGVPQIVITREFAAPRELVFRAYTEPELLAQWLGPRRLTVTVDHLDVRHGGTWRWTHRDRDGNAHAFRGVYHGTPSPAGIVQTYEYEGAHSHVFLNAITFEEHHGKSLLRQNSVFQSVEDRDKYVKDGMDEGIHDSMERLDELLTRLITPREV
jgi:uncharacterized protein YndB with AHSA1/START domain